MSSEDVFHDLDTSLELDDIIEKVRRSNISVDFKEIIFEQFDRHIQHKTELEVLREYKTHREQLDLDNLIPKEDNESQTEVIVLQDASSQTLTTSELRPLRYSDSGRVLDTVDYFSNQVLRPESPRRSPPRRLSSFEGTRLSITVPVTTSRVLQHFFGTSTPVFSTGNLSISTYLTTTQSRGPRFSTPLLDLPIPTNNNNRDLLQIEYPQTTSTSSTTEATEPTMANLSAQDLQEISNLIQNSPQTNDTRLRQFNGSPTDAVQWIEEFEYYADANGWDNNKRRTKLGTYLTGPSREWFTLEIKNTQLDWDHVKNAFYEQFLPVGFEQHMRRELRNRKQKLYEPSANYIRTMRAILKKK